MNESESPSPDEVRRWIDSLYDRAESDTGTFNATRAAAIPRQRGAAAGGRSRGDAEPTVGTLARQWFDVARAKLGPTVPAPQPDRRLPVRPDRAPQAARPERPAERPAEPRALEAPQASTGVARELTAGSAQASTTGSLPELADQRVAPAAAGESRWDESAWRTGAQPVLGDVAPRPLYEPAPASAPEPAPLPGPEFSPQSGPQSTMALPTIPHPTAGTHDADLPTGGTDTYGAGPTIGATGATAPYATALSADPTAYYTPGPPVDVTTATYGAGMPSISASALAAPAAAVPAEPVIAPAPAAPTGAAAPTESVAFTARETPSTIFTPGVDGRPWLSPGSGHSTQVERVVAFARAQIGRPCVWGAVGPGSYDAPGLTQAAWKAAGVTLPRTAQAQWGAGVQVSLVDIQVGDLVFFHDDLGHVGIWSGDGRLIHAPGPGALIREESVFFAGQSAIKGAVRPA
ncbi:C40 family peptidase [Streptomyces sp. DH10]|uniref:C40 family peptidase n=1 Tax=Streptomyces sp. DH10 TaxID=3040121 RepID=UPI0024430CAC|nr:C40 family peptidase [Streptomyces sp. DH10]MDG9711309.1 NlpC/P60 family protein [Streptomyces sp. DH10]